MKIELELTDDVIDKLTKDTSIPQDKAVEAIKSYLQKLLSSMPELLLITKTLGFNHAIQEVDNISKKVITNFAKKEDK